MDSSSDAPLRPTLSIEEAGYLLGLSRASAYEAARRGEIPGVLRFGRRIVVSRRALERMLDGASN